MEVACRVVNVPCTHPDSFSEYRFLLPGWEPTAPHRPDRNPQPHPGENYSPTQAGTHSPRTGQRGTQSPSQGRTHSSTQTRQELIGPPRPEPIAPHRPDRNPEPHTINSSFSDPHTRSHLKLSHFFCTRTFHIQNSPFRLEEHQGSSSFCLKVLPYIMVSHPCHFHPWGPIEPIQFPFHIACSLNICRQLSNRRVFSSQD